MIKFHFFRQTYNLKFRAGFLLLSLFFISLFCLLGAWQLHRYHYKTILLLGFEQRQMAAPKPFLELTSSPFLSFQPVTATGKYINELTMFVQNQFYQGQLGVEVLTPFQITGEQTLLLIDRGWIKKSAQEALPTIERVEGEQHLLGDIKLLNEYQFILGKNILQPTQHPLVMQKIVIADIKQWTHHSFYPVIVRLAASQAHGFAREQVRVITTVLPERHMAYAIQWFIMAFVLLIAYLCFCCERVKK
jgi:surfeit locus 1 family protein